MTVRSLVILSGALLAACGDRRPPPVATPQPPDAGATTVVTLPDGGTTTVVLPPTPADDGVRIAPHNAMILATALDRSGTAAVTLDLLGDVRLWRALDGTQPPIALPFHGARALELAVDGNRDLVVGRIDPAGACQLYRFDRTGKLVATGSAPAVPQAIGLVAVSATAWMIVRADHSIVLADDHGAQLDELAHSSLRIEALRPMGADGAIAIVSHDRGGDASFGAVAVGVAKGKLVWGQEVALPVAPVTPVEVAASPDGKRLAYFADHAVAQAAEAERQAPAQRRPGPGGGRGIAVGQRPARPAPAPAAVVMIDAATGAVVTPKELGVAVIGVPQRLGFSSAETLHVFGADTGDFTVALAADADLVPGTLPRSSAPAVGPGLIASGYDRNLLIQRDGGDTRYLGYQVATPSLAALSPDGGRVAWATSDGQILIETLDGSQPELRIDEQAGGVVALDFLEAGKLFVVNQRGELVLYDAGRGTKIASMTAPGASYAVQYHRRTGWVAGIRDGGGVWVLRLTPGAATPWTAPKIIADGSTMFWLLDAAGDGDPALVTVDSNAQARRYTGTQLAAGVAVGKLGKIAKVKLPSLPSYVDPRGHGYLFGGNEIRIVDALGEADRLLTAMTSPRDLVASPDGSVLIAFDQDRTAFAVTPDGTQRWALGVGAAGWHPAFSLDGRRVALVSGSGGQIVDVATGAVIAARCGWQFGAYPTAPPGFATQVHPICE